MEIDDMFLRYLSKEIADWLKDFFLKIRITTIVISMLFSTKIYESKKKT